MLSSLLRPKKKRRAQAFNSSSPYSHRSRDRDQQPVRHAAADWTETENDDDDTEEEDDHGEHEADDDNEQESADEDAADATPLLPIFSAAHLGMFIV